MKGHLDCDVENDCQADVGNPSIMLQKARNEGSGHPLIAIESARPKIRTTRWSRAAPATARTLSSDMEKSANVICQIAWASVLSRFTFGIGPGCHSSSFGRFYRRCVKGAQLWPDFPAHPQQENPAREQKADDLQNLRRQRGEQNAQHRRGGNAD
jgi:hypothetical protein